MRIISYGGGVQSTAMVVLATPGAHPRHDEFVEAVGGPVDVALFSNVGDDSEHPFTIRYVRDTVTPWAAERGFDVRELLPEKKSIWRTVMEDDRQIIPIRGATGGPLSRTCTADWKVKRIDRYLKAEFGIGKNDEQTRCVGISTDELQRAKDQQHVVYPLLAMGMNRANCEQAILHVGLPVPMPSACFFCPFHRPKTWAEQRRDEPELFAKAVELERHLNVVASERGQRPVYLTRFGKPLDEAITEAQTPLFDVGGPESCDSGYCWT